MHFCVFSYNRGPFLRHCVESIEACAPQCDISVYDDGSNDPETREVLATLANRIDVNWVPEPDADGGKDGGKHGGLYHNMQRALDDRAPDSIVCFIQDDMQLVRNLDDRELAGIQARFAEGSPPRLLQPAFFKGSNREQDQRECRFDVRADAYFIDRFSNSAGAHYSDIHIASVTQLRRIGWQFQARESANEAAARQTLQQMLYLRQPFAAWLPGVPAWRGRIRTLGLRLAQQRDRSGFYPFQSLSGEALAQFMTRDPQVLPFAEDFLSLAGTQRPKPWHYHPLQGRRFLTLLDSLERKLRY